MCLVDGCSASAKCRGYCGRHYQKLLRYGRADAGKTATVSGEPMKFLMSAIGTQSIDCLFWPFGSAGKGYPMIPINGISRGAHRIVCEVVYGQPSIGQECAHSCGNGHLGCINPKHLRWATRSENFADKIMHGTSNRGENHPLAKLKIADVVKIRKLYGQVPTRLIAQEFKVRCGTINKIARGDSWRHLIHEARA